jgi:flagellar hook-associated protein 1 FlgK
VNIQSALYDDNIAAQQSVSGVNIDEEGANLLRYQQAYAAAAQVIAASSKLFDSLMAAVR